MRAVLALVGTFVLFAASFALHIVGGATDQGWLFALAVALIYFFATGYPAIARLLAGANLGRREGSALLVIGTVIGLTLTNGALWAANGRAFSWWQWPVSVVAVAATSMVILALARFRGPLAQRSSRVTSEA